MIVRILDDGQYELPDTGIAAVDDLDAQLLQAVETGDDTRYHTLVETIVDRVHQTGRRLPPDHLGPSTLIVPGIHTTRAEIARLLDEQG